MEEAEIIDKTEDEELEQFLEAFSILVVLSDID